MAMIQQPGKRTNAVWPSRADLGRVPGLFRGEILGIRFDGIRGVKLLFTSHSDSEKVPLPTSNRDSSS